MKILHQKRGAMAEELAAQYLRSKGFRLLARNFRCPLGEIDLIARQGNAIHFVEVKGRWSDRKGGPLDQITPRKMKQIAKVAAYYLQRHSKSSSAKVTFSVIGIDGREDPVRVHWVPEAFEVSSLAWRGA